MRVTQQRRATSLIRDVPRFGFVRYDYDDDGGTWFTTRTGLMLPTWLRGVLGNDAFGQVIYVRLPTGLRDEHLPILAPGLSKVEHLNLDLTQVGDAGLRHLTRFDQLQSISLNDRQATRTGLSYLSGVSTVRKLWITGPKVTDATLDRLAAMTQLEWLILRNGNITDAGFCARTR